MTVETVPSPLKAECANCASWKSMNLGAVGGHASAASVEGVCTKGLAPPAGEPLCQKYQASPAFQKLIVSRMMQDPMILPVPLRSRKLDREAKRRRRGREA